jgi:hypothetical protein
MKIVLILILSLNTLMAVPQADQTNPPRGEFYNITEAYLFVGDSIYTMKEEYVDIPSNVFFMFTHSGSPDSSIVISIDHGKERVMFLGFAQETEAPGDFSFLPGKKNYYFWKYQDHNSKEPLECFVIKEYITEMKDLVPLEYYRLHFIFEEEKFLFYCNIPEIHFLKP